MSNETREKSRLVKSVFLLPLWKGFLGAFVFSFVLTTALEIHADDALDAVLQGKNPVALSTWLESRAMEWRESSPATISEEMDALERFFTNAQGTEETWLLCLQTMRTFQNAPVHDLDSRIALHKRMIRFLRIADSLLTNVFKERKVPTLPLEVKTAALSDIEAILSAAETALDNMPRAHLASLNTPPPAAMAGQTNGTVWSGMNFQALEDGPLKESWLQAEEANRRLRLLAEDKRLLEYLKRSCEVRQTLWERIR